MPPVDTLDPAARRRALADALAGPRAARITDVVERMRALVGVLPPADGLRAFTSLYLEVTEAVRDAPRATFEDVRFTRWLDVVFANLYFDAVRAFASGRATPRAWRPLVEPRPGEGVLPLQFALAGMNAHINRDLPVALVTTCEARRLELRRSSPQYRDFCRINKLLATVEDRVKARLVSGALGAIDAALGRADDVLAMWNVERAREAAWVNGETLWALRRLPHLRARYLETLDGMVGFAGRGLLRPVVAR